MKHKLYVWLSVALIIIISATILFFWHNYKHTRRNNLSDEMYALGVAAIEITDDYLSEKLSIIDALLRLKNNYDEQTKLRSLESFNLNGDISFINDISVRLSTGSLIDAMNNKRAGIGLDSQIKDARDKLAKALWE